MNVDTASGSCMTGGAPFGSTGTLKGIAGNTRRNPADGVSSGLERLDVVLGQGTLPSDVKTYHRYWDAGAEDDTSGLGIHIHIELRCRCHVAAGKRSAHKNDFADLFR